MIVGLDLLERKNVIVKINFFRGIYYYVYYQEHPTKA